ncbi:MAG: hypothetical protein ACRCZP_05525, partial [Phycicoccus sp.]
MSDGTDGTASRSRPAGRTGNASASGHLLVTGARVLGGDAADVLIADGVVAAVGARAGADASSGTERLDADGLVLLPGFVDLHTHLREPGRED